MSSKSLLVVMSALAALASRDVNAAGGGKSITPTHKTNQRSSYTIETVGDTLHQAAPQNARLIIRVSGADKKLIKPSSIALIDASGKAITPTFREDRKVGHEENTGLPVSVNPPANTSGLSSLGLGVNLNKILGPHGDYAYTKVDWPKTIFTSEKRLQIALSEGPTFVLPLSTLGN